ncbi:MAG: hypothetical protein ACK44A_16930, partial [Roseateles sp.]
APGRGRRAPEAGAINAHNVIAAAGLWRRHGGAGALALWALHVALVMLALPVQGIAGPQPLAYIDSSIHQYQMQVARELWAQGRLIGYDPWFAAGHLGGVNFNVSAKLPALMAALLPSAGIAQLYKLYVALAPGLALLGVRRLGLSGGVAATAAGLAVLCWWVTQLHWYHTAGMVSFVLASYLAFAVLAWACWWRGLLPASAVRRAAAVHGRAAAGLLLAAGARPQPGARGARRHAAGPAAQPAVAVAHAQPAGPGQGVHPALPARHRAVHRLDRGHQPHRRRGPRRQAQPGAVVCDGLGHPTPHHGRAAPEIRGEGPLTAWLKQVLATHTTPAGRILFETSLGRVHDGAHIAGPLAHALGREFIGGPYVCMHHAGFWDGQLFGRPIQSFGADAFRERLALYNVGWVVVHSDVSKAFLDTLPAARLLARQGPLAVYAWDGAPLSYVLKGAGEVASRGVNRLSLQGLAGDEVILKYHHAPGLQTTPAVTLEPVLLPGDPQPFIRLRHPPASLEIRQR